MKKQNLFSSLLISTVALSIALPSLVNADPTGTPPGGNVDATFNSVNAGYGTTTPSVGGDFQGEDAGVQGVATGASGFSGIFFGTNGIYSEANSATGMAAGFYNFAASPAVGVLLGYAGDALLASGPVNLVGRIYSGSSDPTDKYVNIEDTDGVRFGDDAGTPQLTISGANGDIADSVGAVTVKDDNGLELWRAAGVSSDITLTPGAASTLRASGNLVFNLSTGNGTLFFLDTLGNTALSMNQWGIWSNRAGEPVKIMDAEGLGIGDNAGNVRLLINSAGDISDSNSEVTIADAMNVNSYASFYGGYNVYSGATKNGLMDVSGNFSTKGVITAGDADLNLATTAPVTLSSSGINLTSGQLENSAATNGGRVFVKDDMIQDAGHYLSTSGIRGETYDAGTGITSSASLGVTGFPDLNLAAVGGQIKLNGTLASVFPNSVTVKDPQGFQIQNATTSVVSLTLGEDGDLSNFTANPVTVRDDQGLSVKNTFATQTLMSVDSTGDLTARGDIGRFYSAAWSSAVPAAPGAYAVVSKSCSAGDYVTGCDFWLWNYLEQPRYVQMSDTLTCEMHFHNSDAVAQNGWVRPRCFSPDG